jgi:hypothetical protein
MNQIRHLGFTAPEEIRQSLHGVSRRLLAKTAAGMRPRVGTDPVIDATRLNAWVYESGLHGFAPEGSSVKM